MNEPVEKGDLKGKTRFTSKVKATKPVEKQGASEPRQLENIRKQYYL